VNSYWVEHYAKERMSDLTSEAHRNQLARSSKTPRKSTRSMFGSLSGRLVSRLSSAALRLFPARAA
jgi:hypothetical protein